TPTAQLARQAFDHVRDIFKPLVQADSSLSHISLERIHHWNWNLERYPQNAVDPRNLFPLSHADHMRVHRATTSGPHPTNNPIDSHHQLSLDGAWPWTRP